MRKRSPIEFPDIEFWLIFLVPEDEISDFLKFWNFCTYPSPRPCPRPKKHKVAHSSTNKKKTPAPILLCSIISAPILNPPTPGFRSSSCIYALGSDTRADTLLYYIND